MGRDQLIVQRPDTRPAREAKLKVLWEQLLAQNPSNKDLIEVIHTMEQFASAAFDELLKRNPSNSELVKCLHCKDISVPEKAGELLLKIILPPGHLVELVKWGRGVIADKAWKKLSEWYKSGTLSNEFLRNLVEMNSGSNQKFRSLAAELLMSQNPSNSDLISIMGHCEKLLAGMAMLLLLKQNPTKDDFCKVLMKVQRNDAIVARAMAELMERAPSNEELVLIVTTYSKGNELKKKALEKLWQQNPTEDQIYELVQRAPEDFQDQVWERLMQTQPSEKELLKRIDASPIRVAGKILQHFAKPSRKALRIIIDSRSGDYKEQAARILLENDPTEEDLDLIEREVGALSAEVQKLRPSRSVAEIIQQMRALGA